MINFNCALAGPDQRWSESAQQDTEGDSNSDHLLANSELGDGSCSDSYDCPVGSYCSNETGTCECLQAPEQIVSCVSDKEHDLGHTRTAVLDCHCVTYDFSKDVLEAGSCLLGCKRHVGGLQWEWNNAVYHSLPKNGSYELDFFTCGAYNRLGTLCGRCIEGYHLRAFPLRNMSCIPCPNARQNWVKYVMVVYQPLTFLCILMIVFYIVMAYLKVTVVFSYMYPLVFYSQIFTMPAITSTFFISVKSSAVLTRLTEVFISLFGLWNLDFFRPYFSNLCLGMDLLPTLALDYAVAVYPLLLVGIPYAVLAAVAAWRHWRNIGKHGVNILATCFLLCNNKLLSVSFALLTPTKVYQLHPHQYNFTFGLYYASDVEYFGREHLPYAILAIAVLCVSAILPTTLLGLFPLQDQRGVGVGICTRLSVLRSCMDAFQGCYEDGTRLGTRDWRWFSALFFLARYALFIASTFTHGVLLHATCAVALLLLSQAVLVARPYRARMPRLNAISGTSLQLLALFFMSAAAVELSDLYQVGYRYFFCTVCAMVPATALGYGVALVVYWLWLLVVQARHRVSVRRQQYLELPGSSSALRGPCVSEHGQSVRRITNPSL